MPLSDAERQKLASLLGASEPDGRLDLRPAEESLDLQPVSAPTWQDRLPNAGDFARSGAAYLGDTAKAIRHPIQTLRGLGTVGMGVAEKMFPGQQPHEPAADAVWSFIQHRYGSFDAALDTLKHDPVGLMADAASVLSGGGGLLTRAGRLGKLGRVVGAGQVVAKTGAVLDPLNITANAVKLAGGVQSRAAGRAVNSLIKPANREFAYGRNPGLAVAKEGIIASSVGELATKIASRRQQIGQQIGTTLSIPMVNAKRLDVSSLLSPIQAAIQKARNAPRTNRHIIRRLENLQNDLLGVVLNPNDGTTTTTRQLTNLTPMQAFEIKGLIGDLTRWGDNLAEDSIVNAALKKSYQEVRRHLEAAVPGIRSLNERYANLTDAASAAKRQSYALERSSRFGLTDIAALGLGGGAGALFGRSPQAAMAGALLTEGSRRLLASPTVRTAMAAWMAKTTPAEIEALLRRVPGLRGEAMRWGLYAGTAQQRVQDAPTP